jgi:Domain of unknown function (DUF1707)
MSSQSSAPWSSSFQRNRRPGMRVSDAERNEVADRLSKHYSDGRLNQAEFDERLHRAMNAKTQEDFAGLFDDLPDLPGATTPPLPVPPRRRPRGSLDRVVFFGFIVVAAIVAGHILIHGYVIWILVGLVAFLLLRREGHHRG